MSTFKYNLKFLDGCAIINISKGGNAMKHTKCLSVFLAAMILAGGILPMKELHAEIVDMALTENAYIESSNDDFAYRVYSDHIEITKVLDSSNEVQIPDEIEGLPVTDWNPETTFRSIYVNQFSISEDNPYFSIVNDGLICNTSKVYILYLGQEGEYDKYNGPWLEDYVVPDGIRFIGNAAFRNGHAIKHITIPDSVEMIGFGALQNTLVTKVSISANINRIEPAALNSNHLEEIELNAENPHFTLIDGVLFNQEKDTLICYPQANPSESYTIPEGTVNLLSSCFINCRNIKEITLASTCRDVEGELDSLFSLEKCEVSEENPVYASYGGLLYSKDKTQLIKVPIKATDTDEFIVPDGTKAIADYAINNCNIDSITLPASVKKVDRYAFVNGYCHLKSLTVYNPECELEGVSSNFRMRWDGTEMSYYGTIYGYENSTAEKYARKQGIEFVLLEDVPEPTTEPTTEAPEEDTACDVNNDGEFSVTDLILLQKYLLGVSDTELADCKAADFCEDGRIDAFDLGLMKRKLLRG